MAAKRVRLAQRRRTAGYSQEKIAEHLGVERSTVVRWETAETAPQPWVRPKLAAALNITTDELQALLDDVTVVSTEPSERMSDVLENPSSVDLIAVAYLHERIRQLDERYDKAPRPRCSGQPAKCTGR
jgi:transcriptional regulator with XRE-family HTH domain